MRQINAWNMPNRRETAFWAIFGAAFTFAALAAALAFGSPVALDGSSAIEGVVATHATAETPAD